jgi:hypothetical protein
MMVVVILFSLHLSEHCLYAEVDDVVHNLDEAEMNVEKAFILIKDIEIPVDSDFFSELNHVLDHMSDARFALFSEEFDLAFSKSDTALSMSEDALVLANELYAQAMSEEGSYLRNQDLVSGGFISLVLLSGFFSWRYAEKSHREEILKKRPELV